ncbi:hypothetical protein PRIPAC_70005, partial [Pristionchus pacificus]
MKTAKTKRPDIQTFRTLAISAVLSFHLRVFVCLSTSVIISIVLHQFVELRLLSASKKTTIIVVASLYATTLAITSLELDMKIDFTDSRYNFTEINFWNSRMTGNIGRGDCKYDAVGAKWALPYRREQYNRCVAPGNGTARVLILGNSYAGIVVNYLHPWLKPIAKEIRLFAHHGCRILIDKSCPPFSSTWPKIVKAMKPDVTWIISRYNPANLHVYYADNFAHATREQMALLRESYEH